MTNPEPPADRPFRLPHEEGYTNCKKPFYPNDRCGGCDECLHMQWALGQPTTEDLEP